MDASRSGRGSRPHIIVVSYLAHSPYSPRGVRTRAIVEALQRECSVELIAGPHEQERPARPQVGRSLARKALNFAHSSFLLDRFEPWSWRRFYAWRPTGAGAFLIGFPFSPLAYAAPRLERAGVPFVVDVGDPWALTKTDGRASTRGIARMRARRTERRVWSGASGAVVTTDGQRMTLRRLFPELPTLVRPNGYSPQDRSERLDTDAPAAGPDSTLRLAHFGDIYVARLDAVPFLDRLVRSGEWDEVELHQYGSDWTGTLAQSAAKIVFHEPRPWPEVLRIARAYDLALVVGNRDPTQLPSKAVAYLQLPIPRLALVESERRDALSDYVAGKPGWLAVTATSSDAATMVQQHVSRDWTSAKLAEPEEEQWDRVAGEIVNFFFECLAGGP